MGFDPVLCQFISDFVGDFCLAGLYFAGLADQRAGFSTSGGGLSSGGLVCNFGGFWFNITKLRLAELVGDAFNGLTAISHRSRIFICLEKS